MGTLLKYQYREVMFMNSQVKIPKGDEKITIELTVKEAIALTGTRFYDQPEVMFEARKKLKHKLDSVSAEPKVH
jgi:hypothetical protein